MDIKLQKNLRMTARPPRLRRPSTIKAKPVQIKPLNEGVNHPNRIVLINPIIKTIRKKRNTAAH